VVDSQFPAEATACLAGLNERSRDRAVAALVNTHHHADHTDGNISFKGVARTIVAHARADELMRDPPGMALSEGEHLFPDATFAESWTMDAGSERVRAKFYGPAHTSGDIVVTFERANVAHMGDLGFNQRHPIVDRAAGASIRNWITVIDRAAADHDSDTIYIFGHVNTSVPVTGGRADLVRFRDYLAALLAFVESQVKSGRSREEILAVRDPLPGFESFGRFGASGAREAKTVAYEELTAR
jgi:cyclase